MFANHNIKIFVGLEGPNDIEFINRSSVILSEHNADICNLKIAEQEGSLVYIPMGGSTLELWTNRLEGLNVPEIHILDRDNEPPAIPRYQEAANELISRGQKAFITNRREMENYVHIDAVNEVFELHFETQFSAFDDVPEVVSKVVHDSSDSETLWEDLSVDRKRKKNSRVKRRLNREVVDKMTIAFFDEIDTDNEIKNWLREISEILL